MEKPKPAVIKLHSYLVAEEDHVFNPGLLFISLHLLIEEPFMSVAGQSQQSG